ncbi:hypothetical protein M0805_005895 [Coniferiporia weirii]|nr:hypothetical protein M0805_005895 [Coniferiporia weirii]
MRFPRFFASASGREAQYELLPTGASFGPLRRVAPSSRRRVLTFCLLGLPFLIGLTIYYYLANIRVAWANIKYGSVEPSVLPPNFERFYEIERNYPQHNASLPFPEGENGRYMWVSNQHWGLGWNNIFGPLYMMSHVAYLSNRAYVFEPYTWHKGPEPFVDYNGHLIPSRIPLAALVQGPIAGGNFPPEHPAPRAVSEEWFKKVCPEERRTKVGIKDLNEGLNGATVQAVVEKYVDKLLNMPEGCVELNGGMEHPFDWQHFGDPNIETTWPTLRESPVLTEFNWSPLVLAALRTNAAGVAPVLGEDPPPNNVPDLMAVHIRRGDYDAHCAHLANWSSPYMGWNQIPGVADRFVIPPGGGWGENTPENIAIYMDHCWPDIERIAARVQESRYQWEARGTDEGAHPIRRLYILTNGDREWVAKLKSRIMEDGNWDQIYTSRDMQLSLEQKYIAQAVDMAIAQRAAVFIGNGFSSLTANVVLLRRVHDHPLASNHFW